MRPALIISLVFVASIVGLAAYTKERNGEILRKSSSVAFVFKDQSRLTEIDCPATTQEVIGSDGTITGCK